MPPAAGGAALEQLARREIDSGLTKAGWVVQDRSELNLSAARGVAVREFPLEQGNGFADYLLFVDEKAVGILVAKPEGFTLSGVEIQAERLAAELLDSWVKGHGAVNAADDSKPSSLRARLSAMPVKGARLFPRAGRGMFQGGRSRDRETRSRHSIAMTPVGKGCSHRGRAAEPGASVETAAVAAG